METFIRNLRLSLRQARRQPALAVAVILTLGLAIGANTAIFSFVNALLIRPFPFKDPDQLVEIYSVRGGQPGKLSMREILDIREQVSILDGIAAHSGGAGGYNFSGDGRPEEWRAVLTTGNLFEVLGTPLAAGGPWPEVANRERDYRVILTYGVWQSTFGGRSDVVGRSITLDHAPGYQIHGVAGPGFDFPRGIHVYRSIGGFTNYVRRDSRNVIGIARVKRPHGVARLQAELDSVAARLAQQYPDTNKGLTMRAESFRNVFTGDVRPYLLVLLGAVGFVLLIACANVANLLLSRALSREREVSVRVALGAGSRALLGQLLTESTVLALAAAGFGVALAYWWMKLLRALIGNELPAWMVIDLDGRVLAFTAVVSVAAGILSGLAPALHLMRQSAGETLKESGRGNSGGRAAGRVRDWMIVAEVAVAVILLAGAGLLIRGFLRMQSQDTGFRADSIQTFRVALGWKRYTNHELTARYYERALDELGKVPGVQGAGFVSIPPLSRQEESSPNTVMAESQTVDEALRNPYVVYQCISENYFSLMSIPLLSGRFFTIFDRDQAEPVAIVSQRLAERLWPGQNPLGKRLRWGPMSPQNPLRKVVGVTRNVIHAELGGEPSLDMYIPYRQRAAANQYLLVKTSLSPRDFEAKAQKAMWGIDAQQSVFDFQSYEQRILNGIWQLRVSRLLLVLFGFVALTLAAIGIYGVMSYLVGQRKRELGIRMALGATPGSVQALVVRRGAALGAVGLLIGLAGAIALGRGLESTLRGISGSDPLSFAGALGILFAVTLAACAIPAWRAARIDPAVALRDE